MMHLISTANSSTSNDDDELTNLTWLQDNNLLQNMTHNETDESTSSDCSIKAFKEDDENLSPKPASVKTVESGARKVDLEGNLITTSSGITIPRSVAPVRYDPLFHTQTKPPYSFSSLIFMAIESSPIKAMPVKDIYSWISTQFPFYKAAPDGWKNTVRHNLSLNKCFQKIEKGKRPKSANSDQDKLIDDQLASKGSLWTVDPELRPNLLQSINKTPAHIYPYMSTAKTGTNLVQISNKGTSDNRPNGNPTSQIIENATVAIGNHNNISSPSNNFVNQSSGKKIIALEKVPQKNILTTAKRVLIPITKKVGREPEEADAAESMLTLTQCSTPGSLNNGNIFIITNKGENFLPTFQVNAKPAIITGTTIKPQQTAPVKNQIAILTQPIIQSASTSSTASTITFAQPVAGKPTTVTTLKNATVIPVSASQVSQAPTDHNYFNRSSTIKTMSNVITIPASSLAGLSAGQPIFVNSSQTATKSNLIPIISSSNIKTVGNNRIITITANPPAAAKPSIVIKSPVKVAAAAEPEKSKQPPNKKQKVVEDEDGLKCAEALFNLANGTVKLAKSAEKKTEKSEKKDPPAAASKSKQTATPAVVVNTASSTITRSTAKKLKASV